MSVRTYGVHQFNANVGFVLSIRPFVRLKIILFSLVGWGWCMSVKKVFWIITSPVVVCWPKRFIFVQQFHLFTTHLRVTKITLGYCQRKYKQNSFLRKQIKSQSYFVSSYCDRSTLWQFLSVYYSFLLVSFHSIVNAPPPFLPIISPDPTIKETFSKNIFFFFLIGPLHRSPPHGLSLLIASASIHSSRSNNFKRCTDSFYLL